jgi:hypothetical protein
LGVDEGVDVGEEEGMHMLVGNDEESQEGKMEQLPEAVDKTHRRQRKRSFYKRMRILVGILGPQSLPESPPGSPPTPPPRPMLKRKSSASSLKAKAKASRAAYRRSCHL